MTGVYTQNFAYRPPVEPVQPIGLVALIFGSVAAVVAATLRRMAVSPDVGYEAGYKRIEM